MLLTHGIVQYVFASHRHTRRAGHGSRTRPLPRCPLCRARRSCEFSIGFGPSLFSRVRSPRHRVHAGCDAARRIRQDSRRARRRGCAAKKPTRRSIACRRPGGLRSRSAVPLPTFCSRSSSTGYCSLPAATDLIPIIAEPAPETPAFEAGLQRRRRNRRGRWCGDAAPGPKSAWRWRRGSAIPVQITIASRLPGTEVDAVAPAVGQRTGSAAPTNRRCSVRSAWCRRLPAVLGTILDDGPAKAAGLRSWDRVVAVDGQPIAQWADWVDVLRAAPGKSLTIEFERDGVRDAAGADARRAHRRRRQRRTVTSAWRR